MSQVDWSTLIFALPCRKAGRVHPAVATFLCLFYQYPVVSGNETLPPTIGKNLPASEPSNNNHFSCWGPSLYARPTTTLFWRDKTNNPSLSQKALSEPFTRQYCCTDPACMADTDRTEEWHTVSQYQYGLLTESAVGLRQSVQQ